MGEERHPRLALLRFAGEVGTKARPTRLQFRRRLIHNVADALASEGLGDARIEASHDRVFVELPEHLPANGAADGAPGDGPDALYGHPLSRIFGVQSISLVERQPLTRLDDVVRAGTALFRDAVRGRHFAVRARRVGSRERIDVHPRDVERDLGTALLADAAGVDLSNPEVTVRLEIGEGAVSFFTEHVRAPGGLPLGVGGKAVALLSGGFDSAVASWQMLRRGVSLDYVLCNMGGQSHLQGVVRVAKVLADHWSYGDQPRLHAIDFEPVADALREHTHRRYWQVLLKRAMLRAADAIAQVRKASAIVTGDAVGQVSSQTLQNLAAVSRATETLILRPLVGVNKEEIIAEAQRIGTFELSKVVGEYCAMVPRKPATAATLEALEAEEAHLPEDPVARVVATRSVLDLRGLDVSSLDVAELAIERVPPGATLIDLRSAAEYTSEHHPDALHLDFARAVAAYPGFGRGGTYVLCCQFGLMSAHLAERMRASGFTAHHLRGGQRALMKQVTG